MSKTLDKSISQEILSVETRPDNMSAMVKIGHGLIDLHAIDPSPFQPRKRFDVEKLRELANSIEMMGGLIEPMVVRPKANTPGRWELIAGERRLRALRLLQEEQRWTETAVHCQIREIDNQTTLLMAMEENIRRHDLNPIDEAWGFCELEKMGLTQAQIGDKFGVSQGAISNKIRLLKLPEEAQTLIAEGSLSAGHGIALAGLLPDNAMLQSMAEEAVRELWPVKRVEDEVRLHKNRTDTKLNPPMFESVEPAKMAGAPLVQTGEDVETAQTAAPVAPESPTSDDSAADDHTDADASETASEATSEAEESAAEPVAPLPSTPIEKPDASQSTSKPTMEAATPKTASAESTLGPALFFAGTPKPLTAIVPDKLLEWMQTEGVKAAPALTLYARLHQFADARDWSAEAVIDALEGRDLAVLETMLAVLSEIAVSAHNWQDGE